MNDTVTPHTTYNQDGLHVESVERNNSSVWLAGWQLDVLLAIR